MSYPYNNIGVILSRLGRNEEALAQYQRAVGSLAQGRPHAARCRYQYRRGLGLELDNVAKGLKNLGRA